MSLLDALTGDKGLVVRFKADLTQLEAGIAKAKADLTGWRDETNKSNQEMGKWATAATATIGPIVAAGAAVYALQQKYGSMASEITDLSTTTGLSVEKIQQLQRAAILSNTAFSNVTTGANTLTLAIAAAGDKSSAAGKAFAQLGISPTGKPYDQVFDDTANALMSMEDTTRRNEIGATLYGRSWKEMLPFMEDYIKNKEKIQSSPTFSAQELQDLKDAKAAWDDLGNSVTIYTGKALITAQDGLSFMETMNQAYGKLGRLDIGGFFSAAGDARTKQIEKEQQKHKDLLAKNAATSRSNIGPVVTGSAIDPFAGLTSRDAEIKNMTDYVIPALKKKLDDLKASGESVEDIAKASIDLLKAKDELIAISAKETDAQKSVTDATKDYTNEVQRLQEIEKNYSRDMTLLNPRDVSSARSLILRHKFDQQDQMEKVATAAGAVQSAGGKSGDQQDQMEKVATAAGAVQSAGGKSGDLIINIGGKQLAKIPGVVTTAGERSLTQAGY